MSVGVIIVAGLSFFGGMKYSQSGQITNRQIPGNYQGGKNGSPVGGRSFGGMVAGQILSTDTNMLTVKNQDGGSRIVLLSASTTINKVSTGTVADLKVGQDVTINGASNTDGSVNAKSIQIRPVMIRQ